MGIDQPVSGHHIVVGVDGSPDSDAALEWAIAEAQRTRRRLRVVHVVHVGESLALTPFSLVGFPDASSYGADVLRRASERCRQSGIRVTCSLLEGSPAGHLVEAASGADMLVVGTRGHNRAAALVLGSVSQSCAGRARCPVVIVKPSTVGRGSLENRRVAARVAGSP